MLDAAVSCSIWCDEALVDIPVLQKYDGKWLQVINASILSNSAVISQ